MAQAAIAYASAGIPVFPTFGSIEVGDGTWRCECGDEGCDRQAKHPRLRWSQEATSDRDEVKEWWARWPRANVAVPTGKRSGLIAVDLDRREGRSAGGLALVVDGADELERWLDDHELPWPVTLEQRTPGGGRQLIFRDPGGIKTLSGWLPGIDLRGDGGYILVPSSRGVKNSGARYAWLTEAEPAACSEYLAAALKLARGHQPGREGRTDIPGYDYSQAKRDGPPIGARDEFFNAFAFELRSTGVVYEVALAEFERVFTKTDQVDSDPFSWETARSKLDRVWREIEEGHRRELSPEQADWVRQYGAQFGTPAGTESSSQSSSDGTSQGTQPSVRIVGEPTVEGPTDLGNARRLVRLLNGTILYAHGVGWYIWNGTYWRPDDVDLITHIATQHVIRDLHGVIAQANPDNRDRWINWARASESVGHIRAMITLATAEPGASRTLNQFDRHPHLLCTPSGVVDLSQGGKLLSHDPTLLMTRCTKAPYDPTAESPKLDEFHATFLPDPEVAATMYQALGNALWAGNRARTFIIVIGGTTSGKGMWTNGVMETLGAYAAPVNSSIYRGTLDDRPRPDLLRVLHCRLVVAEEASHAWDLHTDQLKRLTGGDTIVARGMRSNTMVEHRADFTPVIVTNEMPHLKGVDLAVRRRLLAIPMERSLGPADEDVAKKPEFITDPATQAALLARLIRGCLAGPVDMITVPEAVAERTMRSFEELDDVGEFVLHMLDTGQLLEYDPFITGYQYCVKSAELHELYVIWVRTHGSQQERREMLGVKQFGARLKMRGWESVRSNGTRWAGKVLRSALSPV